MADVLAAVRVGSASTQLVADPYVVTVNVRGTVRTFQGMSEADQADRGGAFDGREVYRFTFPNGS